MQQKKQHRFIAGLLSLLTVGLGQVYNGQIKKGVLYYLSSLIVPPALMYATLKLPSTYIVPLLVFTTWITLFIFAFSIVDAAVVAKKSTITREYNKLFYIITFFIVIGLNQSFVTPYFRSVMYIQTFQIPSGSMSPNLLPGDYIISDQRPICNSCSNQLKRGDLAVYLGPMSPQLKYVKRVIGIPGDKIDFNENRLLVNNKEITVAAPKSPTQADNYLNQFLEKQTVAYEQLNNTIYPVLLENNQPSEDKTYSVPTGRYFVLGDNRHRSKDSRYVGSIPQENFLGRVRAIYFSISKEGKIRWDRIGLTFSD